MIVGIDASNIRAGGGITHLRELLTYADPIKCGFESVIVWGGEKTLKQLPEFSWLTKQHISMLDGNVFQRILWQKIFLSKNAFTSCDVLFIPGASYSGNFKPYVTMSQNSLPFDYKERSRFGWSLTYFRYRLLEFNQSKSFKNASGMIFLTHFAKNLVESVTGKLSSAYKIVPHGVLPEFRHHPNKQKNISEYTKDKPFKFIYVSIVNFYKHQWNVVEAVAKLRQEGYFVSLDLIGPAYSPALPRLTDAIKKFDKNEDFIKYKGAVPYSELPACYHAADAFIFASSCENLPNILLEAMASGLPIACSNLGPMPEILCDNGIYFDPENTVELHSALCTLITNTNLRQKYADSSYEESLKYSWSSCAEQTFSFLSDVYRDYK